MGKRPPLGPVRRIVIKIGSSSVIGKGDLNFDFLENLSREIQNLRKKGIQVLLVSSGAVALGIKELDWKKEFQRLSIPERQALASVGQGILVENYRKLFSKNSIHIGQILLSAGDLLRRDSFLHLRNAIETLLRSHILPVMNENDSVAIEELLFGENDALAANISVMLQADLLLIFSDVTGLLREGRRVSWISKINREIMDLVWDVKSEIGSGGMKSKIKAANLLMRNGKKTVIASFKEENVIEKLFNNKDLGTLFYDPTTEDKLRGKKRWIAISRHLKGQIVIDEGAAKQLKEKGGSLLARGIISASGQFQMGDLVEIIGPRGGFAQGLSHFSSEDIALIKGAHSSEYSSILNRNTFQTVVHRNNLVIIKKD